MLSHLIDKKEKEKLEQKWLDKNCISDYVYDCQEWLLCENYNIVLFAMHKFQMIQGYFGA
jgi:hypothetical protein